MFIKNSSPRTLNQHEKMATNKQRKFFNAKAKFINPQPFFHQNHQPIVYNPQAELKSKIIKAILSNNQTIQREIDYKKSAHLCLSPGKQNSCKFHLSLKKQKMNPLKSNISCLHANQTYRYNETLEREKIVGKQLCETTRICFNESNFKRCLSQSSQRPSSRLADSPRKRKGTPGQFFNRSREFTDIKPWGQNAAEKQSEYF